MYGIDDAVLFIKTEYQHRHLLLHTHDGSGKIHSCQLLCNYFIDGNLIILLGIRIYLRIAVINSINSLCKKNGICTDLNGTKYCSCICRKIRMTGTTCKEYNFPFCEAFFYSIFGIKSGKCTTYKRVNTSVLSPTYLQMSDT